MLAGRRTRVAAPNTDRADRAFYTDAAGESRITVAAIIDPTGFKNTKYLFPSTNARAGPSWAKTFARNELHPRPRDDGHTRNSHGNAIAPEPIIDLLR